MKGPGNGLVDIIKEVAPHMGRLDDAILVGDVWNDPGLSQRDRSLITVSTLIALCRPEELRGHIGRALDNGLSKEEIGEVITHMAFYAGWPAAANASRITKEVYDSR